MYAPPLRSLTFLLIPLRLWASDLFSTGALETLAGGGLGDGGPAMEASLLPQDVLAGPDGALYIADEQYNRVRAVAADGRIRTVAGDGRYGLDQEPLPALESALAIPAGLAWEPGGQLYIVDLGNRQVRVLGADEKLRTVIGPDHPLVARAPNAFAPYSVAVDQEGRVHVADRGNHRVWQLDPDGQGRPVIETWLVPGLGHAWSGGDPRGTHTVPWGPSATDRMLDFLLP